MIALRNPPEPIGDTVPRLRGPIVAGDKPVPDWAWLAIGVGLAAGLYFGAIVLVALAGVLS